MTLLARKVVEKSLKKKCYGITEGRMDGKTDGMTDRCKPVYPPLFQSGGIKTAKGIILLKFRCNYDSCKVVEKSLMKKCYGITEGQTERRTV